MTLPLERARSRRPVTWLTVLGVLLLPVVIGDDNAPRTSSRLVPLTATGDTAREILQGFAARSRAFGTEIAISGTSARIALAAARKFG